MSPTCTHYKTSELSMRVCCCYGVMLTLCVYIHRSLPLLFCLLISFVSFLFVSLASCSCMQGGVLPTEVWVGNERIQTVLGLCFPTALCFRVLAGQVACATDLWLTFPPSINRSRWTWYQCCGVIWRGLLFCTAWGELEVDLMSTFTFIMNCCVCACVYAMWF